MTTVLGVDGCRAGWCSVAIHIDGGSFRVRDPVVYDTFAKVVSSGADIICIGTPICLLDGQGQRKCDKQARSLLKDTWQRVFWPPRRQVLQDSQLAGFMSGMRASHVERLRLHRIAFDITEKITGQQGLSIQAFSISPKINQVDKGMTPAQQHPRHVPRVCEVHPELSFWALNGRSPVIPSKKTAEGRQERWDLLRSWKVLPDLPPQPKPLAWAKKHCAPDDYIDALVAAWTAVCVLRDQASCIPKEPEPPDDRGLRMEMWLPA